MDASSPPISRKSSTSNMPSLIVRLKLPPRALAMATSNSSDSLHHNLQDSKAIPSPFPPSSPPTVASSPVPGAVQPVKKGRGQGKRKAAPGVVGTVFSINGGDGNGGSGAGTPVPVEKEKEKAKPGPKTNPGTQNAGLRALDRSGRPTRRWKRVEYPVHTCSGYTFRTSMWITPEVRNGITNGSAENGTKVKGEGNWNGERKGSKTLDQDVPMSEASAIAVQ
jgi:hypothetical protein